MEGKNLLQVNSDYMYEYLKKKGISHKTLGIILGYSKGYIYSVIKNTHVMREESIDKMCVLTGMDKERLLSKQRVEPVYKRDPENNIGIANIAELHKTISDIAEENRNNTSKTIKVLCCILEELKKFNS